MSTQQLALLLALTAGVAPSVAATQLSTPAAQETAMRGELALCLPASGAVMIGISPKGDLNLAHLGGSMLFARADQGHVLSWPVAAASGKEAAVAWVDTSGDSSRIMFALGSASFAGGAVTPTLVSLAAARFSRFPSIAVDPEGVPWIAWVDGSMESDNIVVSHGDGSRFTTPDRVSLPDSSEDLVPQIAFDGSGVPTVVWAGSDGRDDEIYWSRLEKNGRWSREARVHPDNAFPDVTPSMTRGEDGRLHVAWSGFDGTSYQVFASSWDGRWTTPAKLSLGTGAATLPTVVAARAGAIVLWNQYDGASSVLAARSLAARGIPEEMPIPRGLRIPVSCKPAGLVLEGKLSIALPSGSGPDLRLEVLPVEAAATRPGAR